MLSLISTRIIITQLVIPFVNFRMEYEDSVLNHASEPPYQYRILQPFLSKGMGWMLSPFRYDPMLAHVVSYSLILIVLFLGIYILMSRFLALLFPEWGVILGLLLFQALVPLSISGYYMEGDYLTVLSYLTVFLLMFHQKDVWIPPVIFVSTLNREQSVFILVIYVIYLYSRKALDRKHILIVGISLLAFVIAFLGIRFIYGFKPSQYTLALHIQNNTDLSNLINRTLPVWLAEALGLVVLSAMAFRKSNLFFKLSFLSLGAYLLIFFFKGNLWEIAKFLPAFLIMIPMSIQTLLDDYVSWGEIDRKMNKLAMDGGRNPGTEQ